MNDKKVTKKDLVDFIYDELETRVEKEKINDVIDSLIHGLRNSLESGSTIELRGFGTFEPHLRVRTGAINPKTGEKVSLDPHYVAAFRAGKELKANMAKLELEK